jgi:hypothetical protein
LQACSKWVTLAACKPCTVSPIWVPSGVAQHPTSAWRIRGLPLLMPRNPKSPAVRSPGFRALTLCPPPSRLLADMDTVRPDHDADMLELTEKRMRCNAAAWGPRAGQALRGPSASVLVSRSGRAHPFHPNLRFEYACTWRPAGNNGGADRCAQQRSELQEVTKRMIR